MEQIEFNIKSRKEVFRVKRMNAIEVLALKSQISWENADKTVNFYNTVLENLEVKCGNDWLRVKEKGRNIYYPNGIEEDINAIDELIAYFLTDFLKPVFLKSSELNK